MTTGQRIAQRRKEQALSQEALGEALGVSRQAIYKWESDATLPEIEKLVALSRMFGVSVGWLLGVESESAAQVEGGSAGEEGESPELTEAQLHMVEEITARYAETPPKKFPFGKWDKRIFLAVCGILLVSLVFTNTRVSQLARQFQDLRNSLYSLSLSLDELKNASSPSQDNRVPDSGSELLSVDIAAGTATFSVWAKPKVCAEGMTAEFSAQYKGGEIVDPPISGTEDWKFTKQVTCSLEDDISLSVYFNISAETADKQDLGTYTGLYSATRPEIGVLDDTFLLDLTGTPSRLEMPQSYVTLTPQATLSPTTDAASSGIAALQQPASIKSIRVGLFLNRSLVAWAEACEPPADLNAIPEGAQFYRLDARGLELRRDDVLCVAAVVIDTYNRTHILWGTPYTRSIRSDSTSLRPCEVSYSFPFDNPKHWSF